MATQLHVTSSYAWCRALIAIIGAGLFLQSFAARPATYSGAPGSAQVVDDETGLPIKGVAVLMFGEVISSAQQPATAEYYRDALTDANGRFAFGAWGPPEAGSAGANGASVPTRRGPVLFFFKPGYLWMPKSDDGVAHEAVGDSTDPAKNPIWFDGHVFRLKRASDQSPKSRVGAVNLAGIGLTARPKCDWLNYPIWIAALRKEIADLRRIQDASLGKMAFDDLDPSSCPGGELKLREAMK